MKNPKRPKDTNQLAKSIVDRLTGETQEPEMEPSGKNPHAVALGRSGGLKPELALGRRSKPTGTTKTFAYATIKWYRENGISDFQTPE